MSQETVYSNFRWYILFTMIIVTATTAIGLIGPAPLTGEIMKTMPNLTAGQVTLMTMSSFNLFVAISALLGGIILDKFGVVKVYIGGLILVAAGSLLMPVCGDSVWGMLFNRMLQGLGTGPIMASSPSLAASYFPHKERGIAAGFQGFSMAFGIVIGLSIIPRLAVSFADWQKALLMIGPMAIVGIILAIIIAFGPKPVQEDTQKTQAEADAHVAHHFKKALGFHVTWIVIAAYFLMSWIFQAFNDVVPGYIAVDASKGLGSLGLGAVKGGDYLVLAQVFFMIGAIAGGVITDKVFKGNGRPIMAVGFLGGAIFSYLITTSGVTSAAGSLVFSLTCCGFFYSFVNPQCVGYIAKNYPKEITGKLGGLATGLSILGGWLGATVGGLAIHYSGYPMSIMILTALCFVGFIVALFMRPKKEGE